MQCVICFETTNHCICCNHAFCKECIHKWYMQSNSISCPVCRQNDIRGYNILITLRCHESYSILLNIENCLTTRLGVHPTPSLACANIDDYMQAFMVNVPLLVRRIETLVIARNRLTRNASTSLYSICNALKDKFLQHVGFKANTDGALRFFNLCFFFNLFGLKHNWWSKLTVE